MHGTIEKLRPSMNVVSPETRAVQDQLGMMEQQLDQFSKVVADLAERTAVITTPAPPSDARISASPMAEPAISPVADRLRSCNRQVGQLQGAIEDIVRRLEI